MSNKEPVAWRGINFTEAEGKWLYRDLDEPFTDHNFNNVGEALYLAPPKREPLSDGVLSKEIDIIKKDSDFSKVRPWQIYYLARRIEELHGIGGSDA